MVVHRGDLWWAALSSPRKSEPGFRRPVLVVQADEFNRSRISTLVVVALSSNTALADAPGNVLVPKGLAKLGKDSVINVSQLITLDRAFLVERVGRLPVDLLTRVDAGLRLVLHLER
ncbi:MAG: type II toxin-antitoxin system PemK/MazF family toxin [Polyangiaceae bacterium]